MLLDEQVDHPVELGLVDLDAVMAAPRAVQQWAHLGHADPAPPQRQRMLPLAKSGYFSGQLASASS
jgi:hypothetical protein